MLAVSSHVSAPERSSCILQQDLYVTIYYHLIPRIEIEDSEAVGISNIISNLITMFPRSSLTALPSDLFTSFINCLTLLTCSFGRSAALEEVVSNSSSGPPHSME